MPLNKFAPFLIALVIFAGCTKKADEPASGKTALTVNGEIVTAGEFGRALTRKLKAYDALAAKDPTNLRMARESVVKDLVLSRLLTQNALAHGITVTESELDAEFDAVRKTYPDDLTFRASLANEGLTVSEWRSRMKMSLLEKKSFAALGDGAPLSDNDLEAATAAYYREHKSEFSKPAQIRIQQIVVSKEDDAERLLKKLKAGANFSELAKKFSISPDAIKGGDIGYLAKGVVLAFDAAFTLKPGQISEVIKSSYGYHIMKVLDKKPAMVLSYEQAKEKIKLRVKAQKQQEAFSKWLNETTKSAKIDRNDALLEKIQIHTEGL